MIHFQFEPDGKIGVHRDGKKRKSSINTVSQDAPRVSARFIYGSTTTHNDSATIHHCGATNAHDYSRIQYGASTIQAGSAAVASGPPTNVRDSPRRVLSFFFMCRLRPSIYRSSQKYHDFQAPQKN